MAWQNNGGGRNPWGTGGSGRGPRGGGGGQPPDFDDIIRKGQQRLKDLIPGGKGPMGFILVFLVLVILGSSMAFTVRPSEQGVVLRFGEWVRSAPPGFNLKLPYPIETVIKPDVTSENRIDIGFRTEGSGQTARRASVTEESLMLTGDGNIADIAFTVFWRIRDAGEFLFNLQAPQEVTIKAVSESVMREILGQTPLQAALTAGRGEIELSAQERIQEVLDGYVAGISITNVQLEEAQPPAQVIDAFRDVQSAEQDNERLQNEAQSYANSIIPVARGQANRLIQEAEAYREEVINRARGQTARFNSILQEYRQAPDVTKQRIYLETLERVLSGMDKIILDDAAGAGVVPYLPLNELEGGRRSNSNSGDQQ